jgi:glycosyltransferase involved in cell wall biosynthesis
VRIALLDLPCYTPPYDHSLAATLAHRGHDVTLVTSRFPFGEAPRPEGYAREELFFPLGARLRRIAPRSPVHRLVKAAEYYPSVALLSRRLRALAPEVVHLQWPALPSRDLAWLRRTGAEQPVVFTAHDLLGRRGGAARDAWVAICRAADRVVVHSAGGADELAAAGIDRARIALIPHPVFGSPEHDVSPPNGKTLLFFGLLRTYKGLDLLVRALAQIPEGRLVVAGDPLDPVGPLQELASEVGVSDRIDWRLGFLPDDAVPALMRSATVVVLPYRRADSSGVLATALGHGRPAVVSDVGGLAETVRRFGAGLVVPVGDVDALAAACTTLLEDSEALAAAFRGTEAARASLGWDAAAESHERVYREVLRARSR